MARRAIDVKSVLSTRIARLGIRFLRKGMQIELKSNFMWVSHQIFLSAPPTKKKKEKKKGISAACLNKPCDRRVERIRREE